MQKFRKLPEIASKSQSKVANLLLDFLREAFMTTSVLEKKIESLPQSLQLKVNLFVDQLISNHKKENSKPSKEFLASLAGCGQNISNDIDAQQLIKNMREDREF